MKGQIELFPKAPTKIKPSKDRQEPRLWFRRFQVWGTSDDLVREIEFRKGLNIVWSPDPGGASADLGRNSEFGHGAGKSLLIRLMRYCLGESTYASDVVRHRIIEQFPEGFVAAEIVVRGETWAVARAFSNRNRFLLALGTPLETLVQSNSSEVEPVEFTRTISSLFDSEGEDSSEVSSALAWLTRDQECYFSHPLDWRSRETGSRSTHAELIRRLLGLFSADEAEVRSQTQKLRSERDSIQKDIQRRRILVDDLKASLIKTLREKKETYPRGQLGSKALRTDIESYAESLEARVEKEVADSSVEDVREELERVLHQKSILGKEVSQREASVTAQEQLLQVLRGERSTLDAEGLKAQFGPQCPICNVPIDLALAEGCGLSSSRTSIEKDKANLDKRKEGCERAIDEFHNQIGEYREALEQHEDREQQLRLRIKEAEERRDRERESQRETWSRAHRLRVDVERLDELESGIQTVGSRLAEIAAEVEGLISQEQNLRSRHKRLIRRMVELFNLVTQAIAGTDSQGQVRLTGKDIEIELKIEDELHTTAIQTVKTIAFDLSALLMSVEGHGVLPAFLIHDSPRSGDLAEVLYHRIFRFSAALEEISPEPLFQYIVTTTSAPPNDLISSRQLVAELSSSDPKKRLFRCHL